MEQLTGVKGWNEMGQAMTMRRVARSAFEAYAEADCSSFLDSYRVVSRSQGLRPRTTCLTSEVERCYAKSSDVGRSGSYRPVNSNTKNPRSAN